MGKEHLGPEITVPTADVSQHNLVRRGLLGLAGIVQSMTGGGLEVSREERAHQLASKSPDQVQLVRTADGRNKPLSDSALAQLRPSRPLE